MTEPHKIELKAALEQVYEKYKDDTSGEPATYIRSLASTDKSLFGLAAMVRNGTIYEFGDTDVMFSIQSITKILMLLVPDQPGDTIFACEARDEAVAMFIRSPGKVSGHTCIKCAIAFACHDVDEVGHVSFSGSRHGGRDKWLHKVLLTPSRSALRQRRYCASSARA